jgi:dihydroxyacid dehydratase/phosphogluconate dehydratase
MPRESPTVHVRVREVTDRNRERSRGGRDELLESETGGGLQLLTGNLGRAMIETSAMKHEHHVVEACLRACGVPPATRNPAPCL